jgi:hypothetical protein
MADKKISALTAAVTPLAGTEVLPVVQSGATVKVAVSNLTAGRDVSALSYTAGNLSIANNSITSSTGTVDLRPASSGFVTIGAARNANWANSFFGLSAGDFYSLSTDGTGSNSFGLASNAYRTATGTPGTWAYGATANATLYIQDRGRHNFYGSISGTANNAITWVPVISTAAGGDVTVNTGNLVIGTSGKGIDFSATPGTGTSELFDDYEEGTWTPAYQTSNNDITYSAGTNVNGKYTKVGNTVFFSLMIRGNITGGTGDLRITGLPFAAVTVNSAGTPASISANYEWTSSPGTNPLIAANLIVLGSIGATNFAATAIGASKSGSGSYNEVTLSGTYQTS